MAFSSGSGPMSDQVASRLRDWNEDMEWLVGAVRNVRPGSIPTEGLEHALFDITPIRIEWSDQVASRLRDWNLSLSAYRLANTQVRPGSIPTEGLEHL